METRVGKQLGTLYYGAALGYPMVEEHLLVPWPLSDTQGIVGPGEYYPERCCQSSAVDLRHLKGGGAATQQLSAGRWL